MATNEFNLNKKQTKEIKYLNKDFSDFRGDLIGYAKNYFPDVYNDFNEASPGMMFIEMASYVGDVLSYYIDNQMKENLLLHAEERVNVIDIARTLGYKTKPSIPSVVRLNVYQVVPATPAGEANMEYTMKIMAGMEVESDTGVRFITQGSVDFSQESITSPRETTIYKTDGAGAVTYFLLMKTVDCLAGEVKTESVVFDTTPKKFDKVKLADKNIIQITEVLDSDEKKWYEVPYLAQDNIFEKVENSFANDPDMSTNKETVPYIMTMRRTSKRFTTHVNADNTTSLWFGAGVSSEPDEVIIPSTTNMGVNLPYGNTGNSHINGGINIDKAFDPANTLFTRAYGLAPRDTTLTIKYIAGGGLASNVGSRKISTIINSTAWFDKDNLDNATAVFVENSLAVINLEPASGGRSGETIEEIKYNALAHFSTQNRAVTREDYLARVYAMPAHFGSIAKVYIDNDSLGNQLAINMYTLGYNEDKQCIGLTSLGKDNLQTYLSQYRMLTDAVNIEDAYVINIGVDFSVIPRPGYNSKALLLTCIDTLKKIFDIENWALQEPIVLSQVRTQLDKVEGVQTVKDLTITNLFNTEKDYSGNIYDIDSATKNGVIYPSMDISIFEVKFPDKDIKGRVVGY
jgi:hypothetical protein